MGTEAASLKVERVRAADLYPQLRQVPIFAAAALEDLACFESVDLVHAEAGAELIRPGQAERAYWVILDGEVKAEKTEQDGTRQILGKARAGEAFGEIPLLMGRSPGVRCEVTRPSTLVRFDEDTFWNLMFRCPAVRSAVLGTVAERLQAYQAQAVHREKLISLGTLVAGLMHELNNPGAAASRATSQMRENLMRLQTLSLRFCNAAPTAEQIECMRGLQEQALKLEQPRAVSSLEEADAEEALHGWLDRAGVENAWKLAPTLSAIGLTPGRLECTQEVFHDQGLSDALNWLEALVSSMQLVGIMEHSLARISELVMAVKKYSRQDDTTPHTVDVHDTLQSTLTILAYKFRQKELRVEKRLFALPGTILTRGTGLNQVWTNLLDNAIDASPQKGVVTIRSWTENGVLHVAIGDQGPGIATEHQAHVFEPFFTTKASGEGTGLGLDIARRITTNYGGEISFTSGPAGTEFLVRLPIGADKA